IYTNKITLPYDQSSFSIDFAALSFYSPEMTQYSYMMGGLDKEWTILQSNRKVYFTNLSPGKYTFKLKVGANGTFAKNGKELVITMERNTSRLITLITQILDFRQTEKKGFSIDFTNVDISAVVQDEYLNFMQVAKKRNLAYSIELPEEHLFARADEEALRK